MLAVRYPSGSLAALGGCLTNGLGVLPAISRYLDILSATVEVGEAPATTPALASHELDSG